MSKLYYGLTTQTELMAHIRRACQVMSQNTASQAIELMIGTACTETNLGTYPDETESFGFGVNQFDFVKVKDVTLYIRARPRLKATLLSETGFDVDFYDIETTCHILKFSPLISSFYCRIAYMKVPDPLPRVGDIEGQAAYYKKHWNSYHPNAKGSVEKYIKDYKKFYGVSCG